MTCLCLGTVVLVVVAIFVRRLVEGEEMDDSDREEEERIRREEKRGRREGCTDKWRRWGVQGVRDGVTEEI